MNAEADKLRGKRRRRKSFESMFKTDQADKEEESKQMKEIAHDAESIQEKEVSDVPLPRVVREGSRPCKDCGKIHERSSLLADERAEDALQDKTNPYRLDDAVDLLGAMNIDLDTVEGKTGHKKHGSDVSLKSLESIFKREGANQAWGFKKDKLEPVLGNVQSNKAEEGMIGAGQRGLGYSNEGYTSVQGSGQSHTISEIPPEMEVIVHDVDEVKEVEKEGYTTEAGNSKAGDPSRATDDDDSLLSPKYI